MIKRLHPLLWAVILPAALLLSSGGYAADRNLQAVDMSLSRGQTNRLLILLQSQGNENSVSFSLCFDPGLLTFIGAVGGADATNSSGTLTITSDHAGEGKVGFNLALPASQVFDSAGSKAVVEVLLQAAPSTANASTAVTLCDTPVTREVDDALASALPTSYSDASVTILNPCTYALDALSASLASSGGSGTVNLTTDDGCAWSVSSGTNWITINSAANNTNSGTVSYTVSANPTHLSRTGTISIDSQTLTITQDPAPCTFTLGFSSTNYGFGAITDSVSVSTLTGCVWSVTSGTNWITINSAANNTNSGTVSYTVSANPTHLSRTGTISIDSQTLTITQDPAPCTFTLGFSSTNYGFGAITDSVSVSTLTGCVWSVTSGTNWITINSAANNTNNGTVSYTVSANPTHLSRTGLVSIAGQTLTISQDPAGCTFALGFTSTNYSFSPVSDSVSVTTLTGCVWSVTSGTNWITINSVANNTNSGTASYTVSANPTHLSRTGLVSIAGQTLTISQDPAPCTFGLGFTSTNYSFGAVSDSVSVNTLTGCVWSVASGTNWITINSTANNTNSGTVSYTVSANPAHLARTGLVSIAGQTLTISQDPAPCTFVLGFVSTNYSFGAITDSVSVSTLTGCVWSVSSATNWITISSAANNTNTGTVSYTVSANPTHLSRTGTISIDSQTLTISQDPAPCAFTLGFSSTNYGFGAITGSVSVSTLTGCVWSVTSGTNWITINSAANNTNSGTVSYTVSANPTHLSRTGTISIDSRTLTITQDPAPCAFTLGFSSTNYGFGAITDSVSVSTLTGCVWSVTSGTNWITINSAANNTNSGTVSYTISANPTHLSRTGTISIDSQTLTITQDPAPCAFTLGFSSTNYGFGAITGSVSVSTLTGCVWSVTSGTNWITINSAANNTNSGTVSYTVSANPTHLSRTGTISIDSQTLTITQDPAPCAFTLGFSSTNYGFGAITDSVSVSTLTGCVWSVTSGTNWITINSAANNTNSGTVSYTVSGNPTHLGRTGFVSIAGQTLAISQDPTPCTFSLSFNSVNYGFGSNNDQVTLTTLTGCVWTAVSGTNWITINSAATNSTNVGTVKYTVAANPTGVSRTGQVFVADQVLTISQDAAPCTYVLSTNSLSYGYGATNDSVSVSTPVGCPWTALSGAFWITVTSASDNTGSSTVSFSVDPNPTGLARTGLVAIANQFLKIRQDPAPCAYALDVTNASYGFGTTNDHAFVTTLSGCSWTAVSGTNWITIVPPATSTNSGSFSFSVQANPTGVSRTGLVFVGGQTLRISQAAASCTNAISFSSVNYRFGATNDSVNITSPTGCVASAVSGTNWIAVNSVSSNTPTSASVSYSVSANPTHLSRTGLVFIGNQTLTVSQDSAPCTNIISFSSANYSYVLTNDSVSVSTLTGCVVSAVSGTNWISINSATNDTPYSGFVSYAVSANPTHLSRTGFVFIGNQTLAVSQDPAPCTNTLGFASTNFSYTLANAGVSVNTLTGCVVTAVSSTNWITVNAATNSAPSSGGVSFTVGANPTHLSRTGFVFIGNQTLTLTQDPAPCTNTLGLAAINYSYILTNGAVSVSTLTGCVVTAVSGTNWIAIVSATNGTPYSGFVNYTVASNPTHLSRTGFVFIGNQTLAISQDPAPCTNSLAFTAVNYSFISTNAAVSVNTLTGCVMTAVSGTNWITISSATNNAPNSGFINYSVAANPTHLSRTGFVSIGNQTLTISQDAAPCTNTLGFNAVNYSFPLTNDGVNVTTITGCVVTAVSGTNWITVNAATNSTPFGGGVSYTVSANPTHFSRTGLVFIGNQTLTVTQGPAPCTNTIGFNTVNYGYILANDGVRVSTLTGCVVTAISGTNWITVNAATNDTLYSGGVSFTVSVNPTHLTRTGFVFIGNQTLTVSQDPAPCTNALVFTSVNYSYLPTNTSVGATTLTGCLVTATSGTNWITVNSATNNTTDSGFVTYTVAANPTHLSRTGLVFIGNQTLTISQDPAPCAFALGTNSVNYSYSAANDQAILSTLTGCVWTATSGTNWIIINSAVTNTPASGIINYSVSANPTHLARSGTVTIADQVLAISQDPAPCTFALGFNSVNYGFGSNSDQVTLTTLTGCVWTATSGTNWITVASVTTNAPNLGTINYSIAANPSHFARTSIIAIADQTLAIIQSPAPCAYALTPANWIHRAISETGQVSVATIPGCPWSPVTTNDWITITSGANNADSGSFGYVVAANSGSTGRTGIIMVADQIFTAVQVGAGCSYVISPTSRTHGNGAANNSVKVTTGAGCPWTIITTNDWITLTNSGGTGTATNFYSVTANKNPNPRFGVISIAGEVLSLTQWGTNCAFTISPAFPPIASYAGGPVSITVNASSTGCSWNAVNTNAWISFAATTGTGATAYTVTYTNAVNLSPNPRTGFVTIGGQLLTVTQAGFPCAYVLSPPSLNAGFTGASGQVTVTASNLCPWAVTNTNSWITITAAASNLGVGSFNYSVVPNPTATPRAGVVAVADQSFAVNQDGAPCVFSLSTNYDAHSYGADMGSVTISSITGCNWLVNNTNLWIMITSSTFGTGTGLVTYALDPNPNGSPRTGSVSIADQTLTIRQAEAPCIYGVSPGARQHGAGMETNSVSITTLTGCPWSVSNTNTWITITSALSGSGNGNLGYVVSSNLSLVGRTGVVTVANQSFTVSQAAATCSFAISPQSRLHSSAVETGQVDVATITGCSWAVNNTNSWITITSGSNYTNNGSVKYTVSGNPNVPGRTGVVMIANLPFTVIQSGIVCTYLLSSTSQRFGSGPANGTVNVITTNLCPWTVVNTNSWIIAPTANVAGNGAVSYSVLTNPGPARAGSLLIAGLPFTISQNGSVRLIHELDTTMTRGQTNHLLVVLESLGNENALSFSFGYDPNLLTFVSAVRGVDAIAAGAQSPNVNTNQVLSAGRVGILMGLSAGRTFPAGPNTILDISFATPPGAAFVTTSVTNSDKPIGREVDDIAASILTTSYSNATVTLLGVCTYALTTNSASFDSTGGSGSLGVAANSSCSWTVTNNNDWITITSATTASGNSTVSYIVAPNLVATPRAGALTIAGQSFTVTQAAAPCVYSLSPTNWLHGSGAETGLVAVTATAGCNWTAGTTNNWITFSTPTNGSGNGSFGYNVAANPAPAPRTGAVMVADQIFLVAQAAAPCNYSLSAYNGVHGSGGETGQVNVLTLSGCSWTVGNTNNWVSLISGASGDGTGTVVYSVSPNLSLNARAGVLTIANQTFNVSQLGADCGYAVSPSSFVYGYIATNGSLGVTTSSNGCSWGILNTNTWISFGVTAGTGNVNLAFSLLANPLGSSRAGVFTVAGQQVTINQAASPCVFSINPTSFSGGPTQTVVQVTNTVFSSCVWNVSNTNTWITITSPASSAGPGIVSFIVLANPTGLARSGVVAIADKLFAVTQAAAPCAFTLGPSGASYSYVPTNGSFNVTTLPGCNWTATNLNSWITITSSTNGIGNGSISYVVTNNPNSIARSGVITVANQAFTVAQSGAPCTFSLSASSQGYTSDPASGSVDLTTPGGCVWGVTNANPWIFITSPPSGNIGSGSVAYTISANPTSLGRTGTVLIANQQLSIGQAGAPCTFSLSTNNVVYQSTPTNDAVTLSTLVGCNWSIVNTNPWITVTSSLTNNIGSAAVLYTVTNNPTAFARTGTVTIADQSLTVSQNGGLCTYTLIPTGFAHGSGSETGLVTVSTLLGCPWGVVNTNTWITINPANISGTGTSNISYTVATNLSVTPRTGTVTIANAPYTVTQSGLNCTYSINPTSKLHDSGGVSTGLVSIVTQPGCPWIVVNTNSWIVPKTATNGTGPTDTHPFRYNVTENPDPSLRTGYLIIAGQVYRVDQLGTPCSYSLSATGFVHGSLSDTGMVTVATGSGCPWTVNNTNTWVSLTSPATNSSFGMVTYLVAANPFPVDRTGFLSIAGSNYLVMQLAGACSYTLTPNSSPAHNYSGDTGQVSVASFCSWNVTKSTNWITIMSGSGGNGNGSVTYTVATNPTALLRTATISVGSTTYSVTQAGSPCTYSLVTSNRTHGPLLETGSVSVVSLFGCPWTVANTNPWVNFVSTNYTGNTNANYTVSNNPTAFPRTALLTVAGAPYTITQSANFCIFTLSPTNRSYGYFATNGTVGVTNPIVGCGWTVNNTNSWINITSNTNGSNNGIVTFTVTNNPTGLSRAGVVTIANQPFTIAQSNAPCTFSIFPTNLVLNSGLNTGSVNVISLLGCNWGVANTNTWIAISPTNGSGSGPVFYTVSPNPNPTTRVGRLTIAGQAFFVTNLSGVAINCAANKTVECGAAWNFDPPIASSSCPGPVTVQLVSTITNAGPCGATYTAIRTWQATDSCSNSATCSQTVQIVDTTPPTLTCAPNKTVEFGTPWTFDTPLGASDICSGTNVTVAVIGAIATNRAGFCGNTFSARRTWQATDMCSNTITCSQLVTVIDATPPVLICPPDRGVLCPTNWSFDTPTATDVGSGTNVTITLLGTFTNGVCGVNGFSAVRTWQAVDECGNIATCSQTIFNAQVLITGTVSYPTTYPGASPSAARVGGVTMNLAGTTSQTIQTASDGTYGFSATAPATVTVTPILPNSNPVANGVTTVDISLIRRHILNIASLDSPYKLLAADVNGSQSVTTLDISFIRKMILGTTNIFPAGLWRLVPADYVFPDPLNPWTAPSSRSYTGILADRTNQDFWAIKLGDVNNTWTPPAGSFAVPAAKSVKSLRSVALPGPAVIFEVSSHTNQPGDTVVAQVSVAQFSKVTSAQFTLGWDPAVLKYDGVGDFALTGLLAGNFGTLQTNSGLLAFSWDDPAAAGVTLADGTAIFAVRFQVIGSLGSSSPLNLVDTVTEREVGINFAEGPFHSQNGQVLVPSNPAPLLVQPRLGRTVHTNGVFSVPLPTVAGQHYILEFSDTLPGTNWTALPTVTGDGTLKLLTDPAANGRQRFYRLRIE